MGYLSLHHSASSQWAWTKIRNLSRNFLLRQCIQPILHNLKIDNYRMPVRRLQNSIIGELPRPNSPEMCWNIPIPNTSICPKFYSNVFRIYAWCTLCGKGLPRTYSTNQFSNMSGSVPKLGQTKYGAKIAMTKWSREPKNGRRNQKQRKIAIKLLIGDLRRMPIKLSLLWWLHGDSKKYWPYDLTYGSSNPQNRHYKKQCPNNQVAYSVIAKCSNKNG